MAKFKFKCRKCREEYDDGLYRCSRCGGVLDASFDLCHENSLAGIIKNAESFWDYEEFLPVKSKMKITMGEGNTPLVYAKNLACSLNMESVFIKNETMNPTGTFKDRCMTVALTKAVELNAPAVVLGSAGNAASAAAAYAARAKLPCYVLVPDKTPLERIAQTLIYGARLILVRGTVNDCIDMVTLVSNERGWHNVTTACTHNPFQAEGPKTIAYEVARQLGWKVPDWILVPIGGGGILSAIWKGFNEMKILGLIDRLPRMAGVQASGCAAVVKAFKEGREPEQVEDWGIPDTIAAAIADPYPLDGTMALKAIYDSDGYAEWISDQEIMEAQRLLALKEGILAEPASVTTVMALKKLRETGIIHAGEGAVCIVTGTGMKDPRLVVKNIKNPPVVDKNLSDLIKTIDGYVI